MNKGDLVSHISESAGLTKAQATDALNAAIEGINGALKRSDKVSLTGFGTFSMTVRAARAARNPKTGETVMVAEKRVPKFKPGKELGV